MRPYRNITDTELAGLGAVLEWDPEILLNTPLPAKALWVHTAREKHAGLNPLDERLIRTVTVLEIRGEVIKTDFGSYALSTGKNMFYACGCKRFCDCYGQLYLFTVPAR